MDNNFNVVDVVNSAINGDVAGLEASFNSVLRSKIDDAIESRKQELGQNIGSKEEE